MFMTLSVFLKRRGNCLRRFRIEAGATAELGGCGVRSPFPSYKRKNTFERFLSRSVIGKARAHPILNMRSLSDFEQ